MKTCIYTQEEPKVTINTIPPPSRTEQCPQCNKTALEKVDSSHHHHLPQHHHHHHHHQIKEVLTPPLETIIITKITWWWCVPRWVHVIRGNMSLLVMMVIYRIFATLVINHELKSIKAIKVNKTYINQKLEGRIKRNPKYNA